MEGENTGGAGMELVKFLRGQVVFVVMVYASCLILYAITEKNPVLLIQFSSSILGIIAILTNQGKLFSVGLLLSLLFYV